MTSSPTLPLLREIFAGKRLLFTGATGFLGKVVLARLLCELPDVRQLVCVVRTHAGEADEHSDCARERFVREVLRSPAFGPVRERFADVDIESWVGEKLLPVSGNLGEPGFGLSDDTLARLRAGTVDAVVSCAGLVDFEASLEEAYGTNVLGPRHMIQLAHAVGARFALHVSTCYVPGRCDGSHSEGPVALDWTPSGRDGFSLEREVRELAEVIEDVHRESLRQDAERTQLEEARALLEREGISQTEANLQEALEDARARWLRDRMRAEGLDRAERLGWPNTYSFTKCLGEQIIASEAAWLPYTILRPSVIESAERFPFPGWNQGVNTSAPLVYLAKQGFRGWPVAPDHTLDVVPVDWVADAVLVNLGRGLHAPAAAPPVVRTWRSSEWARRCAVKSSVSPSKSTT